MKTMRRIDIENRIMKIQGLDLSKLSQRERLFYLIDEVKCDVLERLKKFTLGLNGETHVDNAIKNCKCDACQVVNWIVKEECK